VHTTYMIYSIVFRCSQHVCHVTQQSKRSRGMIRRKNISCFTVFCILYHENAETMSVTVLNVHRCAYAHFEKLKIGYVKI